MRPVVLLEAAPVVGLRMHLQSTPAPPPAAAAAVARCDAHTCPWWPYSDSKDFRTNAALILIILFSLLLCVLALVSAIRYLLRRGRHCRHHEQAQAAAAVVPAAAAAPKEADITRNTGDDELGQSGAGLARVQVYAKGAGEEEGEEAECAICLSEFVEGEGIKVLGECNHVFHVQCIQQWLNSHSSCPTCRSSCLLLQSSIPAAPS